MKRLALPLVSVIVPVYNAEKYLRQCIESILSQTITNIEVICIDDGSTDNSLSILYDFQDRDMRVSVISQKNQGAAIARNAGLKLAKGRYVGFVDSDDYIDRTYFEQLHTTAEQQKADIARAYVKVDMKTDSITKIQQVNAADYEDNYNIALHDAILDNKLNQKGTIWIALYKQKMIRDNNISFPPDILSGQDEAFNLRASYYANKIVYVSSKSYYHRVVRDGSISTEFIYTEKGIISRARVLEDCIDFLSTKLDYEKDFYIDRVVSTVLFLSTKLEFIKEEETKQKVVGILVSSWRKTRFTHDLVNALAIHNQELAVSLEDSSKLSEYIAQITNKKHENNENREIISTSDRAADYTSTTPNTKLKSLRNRVRKLLSLV